MPRVSLLPAATPANLTGAAIVPTTDKNTLTVGPTYAQLRTALFAGGTGYAVNDPLMLGGALSGVTTLSTSGLITANAGLTLTGLIREGGTGNALFQYNGTDTPPFTAGPGRVERHPHRLRSPDLERSPGL